MMTMMTTSEVKHSMHEMRAELHLSKISSWEQMQLQTTSAANSGSLVGEGVNVEPRNLFRSITPSAYGA